MILRYLSILENIYCFDQNFDHAVEVGVTFRVGLTFKVLSSKWGLLSREGLTIERAYYRAFRVYVLCLALLQNPVKLKVQGVPKVFISLHF